MTVKHQANGQLPPGVVAQFSWIEQLMRADADTSLLIQPIDGLLKTGTLYRGEIGRFSSGIHSSIAGVLGDLAGQYHDTVSQ